MIKKSRSNSILIVSAIIMLITVLVGLVVPINSWFTTSHKPGIEFVVQIEDLKLKLYQNSVSAANLLNKLDDGESTPRYIALSGEILPYQTNSLTLILANEDDGESSMYVRFKFELYALGVSSNTLLTTTLSGVTAPTSSVAGFNLGLDGFYYYQNNSGTNQLFARQTSITLMQGFVLDCANFVTDSGQFLLNGSETLRIVLTIQASLTSSFN